MFPIMQLSIDRLVCYGITIQSNLVFSGTKGSTAGIERQMNLITGSYPNSMGVNLQVGGGKNSRIWKQIHTLGSNSGAVLDPGSLIKLKKQNLSTPLSENRLLKIVLKSNSITVRKPESHQIFHWKTEAADFPNARRHCCSWMAKQTRQPEDRAGLEKIKQNLLSVLLKIPSCWKPVWHAFQAKELKMGMRKVGGEGVLIVIGRQGSFRFSENADCLSSLWKAPFS